MIKACRLEIFLCINTFSLSSTNSTGQVALAIKIDSVYAECDFPWLVNTVSASKQRVTKNYTLLNCNLTLKEHAVEEQAF